MHIETRKTFEAIIGFVIVLFCLLFAVNVFKSGIKIKNTTYNKLLYAKFNNIEGIKVGTEVKIAGVRVGQVVNTQLDTNTFQVKVKLNVVDNLNIPDDSTLAVTSSGLLGGKFLNIKPGVSDISLTNGASFSNTQSALNLEDLIGKVVASFSSK